ncbi:Nn.00g058600.m01.CDS01 [Neocucurbitaria sp. VM-36]
MLELVEVELGVDVVDGVLELAEVELGVVETTTEFDDEAVELALELGVMLEINILGEALEETKLLLEKENELESLVEEEVELIRDVTRVVDDLVDDLAEDNRESRRLLTYEYWLQQSPYLEPRHVMPPVASYLYPQRALVDTFCVEDGVAEGRRVEVDERDAMTTRVEDVAARDEEGELLQVPNAELQPLPQ